ncbi:MAG: XRE family transcriptional regulator [Clostridia bacterium]|nr:XRE family transcriptional regulator [Clostridia bacterium]
MEINVSKLKETVVMKNTTMEALAYDMGMARSTLYRKLKRGTSGITLKDVISISRSLSLSDEEAERIFGGSHVTRM